MNWTLSDIFSYSLIGVLLVGFLLLGWGDLGLVVGGRGRGMGTGLSRVWTVGRTTMLEAWAGRVWLLPVLWLISVVILVSVVRPFDEGGSISAVHPDSADGAGMAAAGDVVGDGVREFAEGS